MQFQQARRAARMNPSIIREILKVTEQPGIISLAGGLPSPDTFPAEAMREASNRVLRDTPREALQYAASEGYDPLREWVAARLTAQGFASRASQVLITTGSQQGLDLVGKVLIDAGSRRPTSARSRPLRRTSPSSSPCRATTTARCPTAWRKPPKARASCTRCRTSRTRAGAA